MCQGKPNLRRARPNPVNHRVFERKLRPKPFGRWARLPGRHASRRPRPRLPSGDALSFGAETGLPCPWCGWPKKESPLTDARLVVVVKAFVSSRADAREALSNDPNVSSCNDASTATPADGGRRCVPVGCGTARAGPPIDSGRWTGADWCGGQSPAVDMPVEMPSRRSWLAARAVTACLGTCVLPAPACGHPIRPVLKHGPRSLTCDGAAASLSRATESRAPSGPFLPAHPGIDSVGGKGSRQNGSVTSGKGLALRAGHGGPSPEPVGCRRTARAASAARSGSPRAGRGTDWERPLRGPSPGVEQQLRTGTDKGNPTV
ncbi:hypothetical protein L6452_45149 [Arctium lappa]|nr:hypothetical protein L6452_45149 [Arctium lappa]